MGKPVKPSATVRAFANSFGVVYRVAKTPKEAKIYGLKIPKGVVAAYVGQGVVWVRSDAELEQGDLDVACLHELGHAILDFFPIRISKKMHEIKANAIALGFAAHLRLPVSDGLVKSFGDFTRTKSLAMRKPRVRKGRGGENG